MERSEAEEKLDFIKNLMENSSRYGGSLADVYLFMGICGMAGAGYALGVGLDGSGGFLRHWMMIATVVASISGLMIIKRAYGVKQEYGMGATKRVAQSVIPQLVAGALLGVGLLYGGKTTSEALEFVVGAWVVLFGCAMNSASYVVLKGLKTLSWVFIYMGGLYLCAVNFLSLGYTQLNLVMGFFFGALLMLYSGYLFVVENKSDRAS